MDANIGDPRLTPSVERAFEVQPLPGFWGIVTLRAMVVSAVLGVVFCFVALRIHMTAGIVPALNMPTSVLSFFFLKWFVALLQSCGIATLPFTRQENMFVLTSITTCINMALTGGFATYIIGMTTAVAKSLVDNPDQKDIIEDLPTVKYTLFLFLIGFASILCIVPFTQIMLIDYRLLFPSGSVTAHLVNSFHTPQGAYVAKLQVATLLKTFLGSFSWSVFQWFYTAGNNCGFQAFPTFGLALYKRRFYFDFSATYVGVGMICPFMVNFALLFGAILSWGFLYPYIESKKGQWYHTDSPTSLNGSNGYKVFLGITMILTDGIFNFLTLITTTSIDFYHKRQEQDSGMTHYIKKHPSLSYDDRKRIELFLSSKIPLPLPVVGYIVCAIISAAVIPSIFSQIKFYHVAALYVVAPVFAFCNSYGTGLTDWSAAPTYAKFTIFIIAAWIAHPGAVVASLVACGIINATVHVSSQAMQDSKTGYMTLTSPQVMVTGQIFGVILGSIINPSIFYAFKTTAKHSGIAIGSKHSEYPCPYSGVYRAIGIIGMGGVKELPEHCVTFCTVAFFITVAVDVLRLVSQKKGWSIQMYIPSMTAIALPFFTGSYFTIAMCLGSVVLFVWNKIHSQSAELLSSAVAAGLICGEGLFSLPTTLLSMAEVHPPICMKFLPSGEELGEVDRFLSKLATSAKS
ncbi:probable metal-nicotianamine transporter YSL3 [Phragmites australis]|uniref:probable metal-nicotianamine transporter YSL3 n=1 Tax=Phragmites australis TaxID=29695 RepID=UPI002D78E948|nr:probable metal-nicotianamine transporter YSL3 [Phragmites australis]